MAHKADGVGTFDPDDGSASAVYTPPALGANATFDKTCGDASWSTDLSGDGTTTTDDVGVAGVQNGAKCSVARDGVLVVLGGIRVKF